MTAWLLPAGLALAAAAGTAWYAFCSEPNRLMVTVHRIPTRLWAAGTACTIVHLTDLHLRGYGARERQLIAKVRRLRPDVIALTGDYAESPAGFHGLAAVLAELCTVAPVYGVLGDNDQEDRATQARVEQAFYERGAVLLRNDAVLFERSGARLVLAGVDDPNSGRSRLALVQAKAEALVNGGVPDARLPGVLLAHSPEIAPEVPPWLALVLTGHTHGGQICLPGGRALYTNTPKCRGYAAGAYRTAGGTLLYVNRGIGTARIPARLFCPPEIAVFELYGTGGA